MENNLETTIIGLYTETTTAPAFLLFLGLQQQNEASLGLDLQDRESGGQPSELMFRRFQEDG